MSDQVMREYTDKTLDAVRDDLRTMEESFSKLLSQFADEFGVHFERIEVEGAPDIWNQQGDRVRQSQYKVKLITNL